MEWKCYKNVTNNGNGVPLNFRVLDNPMPTSFAEFADQIRRVCFSEVQEWGSRNSLSIKPLNVTDNTVWHQTHNGITPPDTLTNLGTRHGEQRSVESSRMASAGIDGDLIVAQDVLPLVPSLEVGPVVATY